MIGRLPPPPDPRRPPGAGRGRRRLEPVGGRHHLASAAPRPGPSKFNEVDFAVAFARIECHFFANRGFFPEDGWILKNIAAIADIPGWIVQGRFDVVTPLESAWALKTAWPKARFEVVWDAGHASTEPGIIDALVRATDQALAL